VLDLQVTLDTGNVQEKIRGGSGAQGIRVVRSRARSCERHRGRCGRRRPCRAGRQEPRGRPAGC
jgi:hypothetical protein